MALPETAAHPTAVEADPTLRNLIGKDTKLEEIFTRERIAAGQKTLDDARSAFFDRAHGDLARLEELAGKNATTPDQCEMAFEDLAVSAGNLRGHAELFGFRLVAAICSHINSCCTPSATHTSATRIQLTGDLIRMLGIAIREKITDETGAVGRELRASLGRY